MRSTKLRSAARAVFIEGLEERRLLSSGALDPSFGTGGVVSMPPYNPEQVSEAVQSDGKTVLAFDEDNNIILQRFLTSGKLDTSFGSNGTEVEKHFSLSVSALAVGAVAIDPSGNIVVAGEIDITGSGQELPIIARFQSNGALDKTFNTNGYSILHGFPDSNIDTMVIDQAGRILIGGDYDVTSIIHPDEQLFVARVTTSGALDNRFAGGAGDIKVDIGDSQEEIHALAIDYNGTASTNPDYGKIVAVGTSNAVFTATHGQMAIMRLDPDGAFDKSFSGDGITTLKAPGHYYSSATGVVIQSGGKIVVGGFAGGYYGDSDDNFVLVRYLSNGTLDKTFGAAKTGIVDQDLGDTTDEATCLVSGSSGYLIEGGYSSGKFAMVAFTPDGIVDSSFGTNGIVKTTFGGQNPGEFDALAQGPNDTIMAAGIGTGNPILARYFDAEPEVSIYSITPPAQEQGAKPATFEVFRDAVLPYATRVYFNVTGTAKLKTDYTGITLKQAVNSLAFVGAATVASVQPAVKVPTIPEIGYVDIPAGKHTVDVTITPIDHGVASANKTAIFTLQSNTLYNINSDLKATTITIVGDGSKAPPVTFQTDKPTADAYVQDGSTDDNKNFGTAKTLQVKASTTAGYNRESYLKFNIASSPTISSATLVLDGELSASDQSNLLMQIFGVSNTSWSETGITWNNKPAAGSTVIGSATILNTTENDYTIDITNYVRSQFLAGNKTISLMLKNASPSDPEDVFSSREGAVAPQLIIVN